MQGMTETFGTAQRCPSPGLGVLCHPLTPQALLRSCFLYPGVTQNPQGLTWPPCVLRSPSGGRASSQAPDSNGPPSLLADRSKRNMS